MTSTWPIRLVRRRTISGRHEAIVRGRHDRETHFWKFARQAQRVFLPFTTFELVKIKIKIDVTNRITFSPNSSLEAHLHAIVKHTYPPAGMQISRALRDSSKMSSARSKTKQQRNPILSGVNFRSDCRSPGSGSDPTKRNRRLRKFCSYSQSNVVAARQSSQSSREAQLSVAGKHRKITLPAKPYTRKHVRRFETFCGPGFHSTFIDLPRQRWQM